MRHGSARLLIAWPALVLAACLSVAAITGWLASRGAERLALPERVQTSEVIGESIVARIDQAIALGIGLGELVGLQDWLEGIVVDNPVIFAIVVTDASGRRVAADRTDLPAGLIDAIAKPPLAGSRNVGEWQLTTLPITGGSAKSATGWLHLAGQVRAPGFDPLAVSMIVATIAALLAGLLIVRLLRRELTQPLAQLRQAFESINSGAVPRLPQRAGRSAAAQLRNAVSGLVERLAERGSALDAKLGEVRAAHFDPVILQQIDRIDFPRIGATEPPVGRERVRPVTESGRHPLGRSLAWVALAGGLIIVTTTLVVAELRTRPVERQLLAGAERIADDAWREALMRELAVLEPVLDEVALSLVVNADWVVPIQAGSNDSLLERLVSGRGDDSLDLTVARTDASVIVSTASRGGKPSPGRAMLDSPAGQPFSRLAGAWQAIDGSYQVGVAQVFDAGGESFVLSATRPLSQALERVRAGIQAPATLANLRGQAIQDDGTAGLVASWRQNSRRSHVASLPDGELIIGAIPLLSASGHTLANALIGLPSGSRSTEAEGLSLVAVILAALAGLGGLLALASRAMARVARASSRLGALALERAEPGSGKAPIDAGEIERSISVLEEKLDSLDAIKRSRERQGRRQARYIRHQMMQLAGRLNEQARAGVLQELDRIEQAGRTLPVESPSAASADGQPRDAAREQTTDEIGIIALGFRNLVERVGDQYEELARLVDELREALRVKTQFIAIQQELEIARKMQLSFLPHDFEVGRELSIHALMVPAKEVGGDFYDFFRIDEHRFAVTVADVSGKGVPAAFFMAVSRTLLRAVAQLAGRPADCLARLNDLLASNNQEMMFVTLFYGIIDTRTGELTYSNAGHNPPYLLRRDGRIEALPPTGDMALAVMEQMDYSESAVRLAVGDGLFMFTDGVTEACDPAQQLFGESRLEALLDGQGDAGVEELPRQVLEAIKVFEDGGAQADDITCLCLRYRGVD
jgi:phosphoserine phosphatase RsbU/P